MVGSCATNRPNRTGECGRSTSARHRACRVASIHPRWSAGRPRRRAARRLWHCTASLSC